MSVTEPATDAAIAEMEVLEPKATPGPWNTWPEEQRYIGDVRVGRADEGHFIEVCSFVTDENDENNAVFIARARQFIPAIIARQRADAKWAQTWEKLVRYEQDLRHKVEDELTFECTKVARLEAEVAKLREALKPFNMLAGGIAHDDLRRAAAVFAETAPAEEDES